MPLLCLSDLRDPDLFYEALHLHYSYGHSIPDVAKNYVSTILGRSARAAQPIKHRKNATKWAEIISARLSTEEFYKRSQILDGLYGLERDRVNTNLERLVKKGLVERRGDRSFYEFRLVKPIV